MSTPSWTRTSLLAGALLMLGACKEPPAPPKKLAERPVQTETETETEREAKPAPEGVYAKLGEAPKRCVRTLCIGGPFDPQADPRKDPRSQARRDLGELCRRAPGVIQRCEGDQCTSVWGEEEWTVGLEGLITTLDGNGDGKADAQDPDCRVNIGGWSTGAALAALDLPAALAADPRTAGPHTRVDNLLVVAPYRAGLERLEIPSTVDKAFVYRQTKIPADDCSKSFEGGPWLSPAPLCAEGTTCYDYDYGMDEGELAYLGRRGARSGAEVGHCNVVALIAKIGLDNLVRGQEAYSQLIPPYADGTHGGREYVPGPAKPDPILPLPNPVQPD